MNFHHEQFIILKEYDDKISVLNKNELEATLSLLLNDIDINTKRQKQLEHERIEIESSLKSIKGHLQTRVNAAMYENLHAEVDKLTKDLDENTVKLNNTNKLNMKLSNDKDHIEMKLSMYMNRYLHCAPLLDTFIEQCNNSRSSKEGIIIITIIIIIIIIIR
jgi:DNA-nicking Smr family endonuclease